MLPPTSHQRFAARLRFAWAIVSVLIVETCILGLAAAPAIAGWRWGARIEGIPEWGSMLFLSVLAVPSYLLFAFGVLVYSAWVTRLLGWRTLPGLSEPLDRFGWPLLNWGRYLISIHVARMFAGAVFRSTPIWLQYMRWNGARIGRGVWVNSLSLMDHNLLEFGDGVVIGSDARVSGHTVERGMLETAVVRIGAGSTIGIGSVIGIGTEIGTNTQVGALSVVPKFSRLEANTDYAGAPVHRLPPRMVAVSEASDSPLS